MKTDREKPHDQSDVTAEGRPRWLAYQTLGRGRRVSPLESSERGRESMTCDTLILDF